ncbi:hypothetical protein [Chromobacterium paludis]|uniref:Uncharacterized protein n=1 Tax=Chromobacterium paludis TaxID=2605945 RepID=A0A5C1DK90_9NEIS|nr:hypothetical protein [Chromobacterium paludis]QEL57131.1 hypothetical protein FYK34_16995 [Chromobacterium paludis]
MPRAFKRGVGLFGQAASAGHCSLSFFTGNAIMASFFMVLSRHLLRDMLGDEARPADAALRRDISSTDPRDGDERLRLMLRLEQCRLEKGGLC